MKKRLSQVLRRYGHVIAALGVLSQVVWYMASLIPRLGIPQSTTLAIVLGYTFSVAYLIWVIWASRPSSVDSTSRVHLYSSRRRKLALLAVIGVTSFCVLFFSWSLVSRTVLYARVYRLVHIDVNGNIGGILLDEHRGRIFISNSTANRIEMYDMRGKAVRPLHVGLAPRGMALSKDGATLFVCNSDSEYVSVIDLKQEAKSYLLKLPEIKERKLTLKPTSIVLTGDEQAFLTTTPWDETVLELHLAQRSFQIRSFKLPAWGLMGAGFYGPGTLLRASPDGTSILIVRRNEGSLGIFELESERFTTSRVIVRWNAGSVRIFQLESERFTTSSYQGTAIGDAAFGPDGSTLVAASPQSIVFFDKSLHLVRAAEISSYNDPSWYKRSTPVAVSVGYGTDSGYVIFPDSPYSLRIVRLDVAALVVAEEQITIPAPVSGIQELFIDGGSKSLVAGYSCADHRSRLFVVPVARFRH